MPVASPKIFAASLEVSELTSPVSVLKLFHWKDNVQQDEKNMQE